MRNKYILRKRCRLIGGLSTTLTETKCVDVKAAILAINYLCPK
jgi:hypothetical protein